MRRALAHLVLYAGAAVLLTWPLCLHLGSRVLDDGTLDGFQFTWDLWWTRVALLDLHTSPFHTRQLFFPAGVDLFWHTLSATTGVLSLPFALLGPGLRPAVAAENAMSLLALVATTGAAAFLVYEVTGRSGVAAVAALAFTASPFYVRQLHTQNLNSLYWLLACMALWWRLHERRRWAPVAGVAATLVLAFFAAHDYAVQAVALLLWDLAYRGWRAVVRDERGGLWVGGGVAALGLGVGALAAAIATRAGTAALRPPFDWVVWNSAYLSGFFTPPWLPGARPALYFGSCLYLGAVPIVFAALGQALAPEKTTRWNVAALLCLAAALGPLLQLGAPAAALYRHSPVPPPGWRGWLLPYRFAYELVPGVAMSRAPWRWVAAARVCLVVAAGCGLGALARRMPRGLATAAGALLVAVAVLEAMPERLPAVPVELPACYAVLRADAGAYGIVDLPSGLRRGSLGLLSSRYMAYQTSHRRPLAEGTVARLPPSLAYVFQRADFHLADHPELRYAVVHRWLMPEVFPRAPSVRLVREARALGDLVFRDRRCRVYRLRTYRAADAGAVSRGPGSPG